jgi:hypothetical protein
MCLPPVAAERIRLHFFGNGNGFANEVPYFGWREGFDVEGNNRRGLAKWT